MKNVTRRRVILHIDMNSYYATLEQQAHPNLRNKPIGIIGKGGGEKTLVIGASIEAKKQGVVGPMTTWEAKNICPNLIIVPANYDRYVFTSRRIFSIIERFSSDIEIFSIDEAFIMLSDKDTWDSAVLVAKQIKKLIKDQVGDWVSCSVGISYGKILAKLASELQKPDGLTVISDESFQEIAKQTPIKDISGIGPRLTFRLQRLGVDKLIDLQKLSLDILVKTFGRSLGSWMKDIAHGIDNSKPQSYRNLSIEKTISHSYTLPKEITDIEDLKSIIMILCERLAFQMRQKKVIPRSIYLYLRFGDNSSWHSCIYIYKQSTNASDIYQKVVALLN